MMAFSRKNVLVEKQERKITKKMTILCFGGQVVSNSGDTTTSIEDPNTIGNAQKYLVSLYFFK